MKYLRIGTEYYKKVDKPCLDGSTHSEIIGWKKHTITDDHGKEVLKDIPKYEGYVVVPSHQNYEQEIGGFYNKYKILSHDLNVRFDPKKIVKTLEFLEHVFGEQYDIGLDYLSILWKYPTQILPILCVVSEERNTGKTTFLNWLKLVFEGNMTINKNEDFRSRFNSDWSEKLIIAIDEVLLDKREDSERIKNLSTAASYKTEAKGKDKVESSFFGKFILCSNNETNFILIDRNEIRYWVRKIPVLGLNDPNLMDKLVEELPYVVKYISERKVVSPKKSRMWFTKSQLYTEALDKLVNGTKFYAEKELILILEEMFEDFETDTICLSIGDIGEEFVKSNYKISRGAIRQILDRWKLKSINSSYNWYYKSLIPHSNEYQFEKQNKKGRFYTFEKEFIKNC